MPYFLTATDTSVGKTTFSRLLLERAHSTQMALRVLKPVCCGGTEDLDILLAAQPGEDLEGINHAYFEAAAAPSVAARLEGQAIDPHALLHWCRQKTPPSSDSEVLIEGAGGWMVPLHRNWCVADWAEALGWPVLIVVGERLGCLNPTLLTVRDLQRRGLRLAGIILNQLPGAEPAAGDHAEVLTQDFGLPLWGRIPPDATYLPDGIWQAWQDWIKS
jgi:dethiobiotin synthetase